MTEREAGVDEAIKPYLEYINKTPRLTSLLYDIDMLPEQCRTLVGATRLIAFVLLFKMVPEEAWREREKQKEAGIAPGPK